MEHDLPPMPTWESIRERARRMALDLPMMDLGSPRAVDAVTSLITSEIALDRVAIRDALGLPPQDKGRAT